MISTIYGFVWIISVFLVDCLWVINNLSTYKKLCAVFGVHKKKKGFDVCGIYFFILYGFCNIIHFSTRYSRNYIF